MSFTDDSDKFSYCSTSFRSHARNSSFLGNSSEIENDFDDQSSLTEVLTTKNDLQAKMDAAISTKKEYEKRKQELKRKLKELNQKADRSLKILDETKEKLTKDNDKLKEQLSSLPTIEFLQEQAKLLTQILEKASALPHHSSFLDVTPLVQIGLLQPGESLAILPQRLQSLIARLNTLNLAQPDTSELKSKEGKNLVKKIRILEKTSPDSYSRTHYQCEQLENEVDKLREEVRLLKERQERTNSQPPITDDEINAAISEVGGDPKKIHKIRGNLYKYDTTLFTIELRFGRLYAITKELEIPLGSYIKTLMHPPFYMMKKHNSYM